MKCIELTKETIPAIEKGIKKYRLTGLMSVDAASRITAHSYEVVDISDVKFEDG